MLGGPMALDSAPQKWWSHCDLCISINLAESGLLRPCLQCKPPTYYHRRFLPSVVTKKVGFIFGPTRVMPIRTGIMRVSFCLNTLRVLVLKFNPRIGGDFHIYWFADWETASSGRRKRDSNPRYRFRYTDFPGLPIQPLWHFSVLRSIPQRKKGCLAPLHIHAHRVLLITPEHTHSSTNHLSNMKTKWSPSNEATIVEVIVLVGAPHE